MSLHLAKMSSSSPFRPFFRPLWPLSIDIFSSLEEDMLHTLEEVKASMKLMDNFYHQLLQETTENKALPVLGEKPQNATNERITLDKAETALNISDMKSVEGGFVISLGVKDFSPEELTVKIIGKKLLVSGEKECKSEDGKGSFSYTCQIFRKEVDLPQDVQAEDLSCTVTNGGQLHVEVSQKPSQERTVPMQHPALQAKTKDSSSTKDSRS
ncbi:heat shock protein beta-11-like [Engystomops pustulosus]|uniref:heat shock protein beta-11-like n=1 Tax=Engystomops pustulosus TaxID=76066 RepID=UPI003AFA506E